MMPRGAIAIALGCCCMGQVARASRRHAVPDAVHRHTRGGAGDAGDPYVSHLTPAFVECMRHVCKHLPINPSSGRFAVHHYEAQTGQWNEDIRFEPFEPELAAAPMIVDVGGNTNAADSLTFKRLYPHASVHVYEPVAEYAATLRAALAHTDIAVHAVGLGSQPRNISYQPDQLAGESTFVMEGYDNTAARDDVQQRPDSGTLAIIDGATEILDLLKGAARDRVDVVHLNCEGCEWELLQRLADGGVLPRVATLQVSFHNYGKAGIGDLLPKYCLIHEKMRRTHALVKGVPFGWERWTLKGQGRE